MKGETFFTFGKGAYDSNLLHFRALFGASIAVALFYFFYFYYFSIKFLRQEI